MLVFIIMLVKELMKMPYVIDKDINLGEAAKIMFQKGIGSLIFVVRGKVKGLVTRGDLLKHFGEKKKISQIMNKNVLTISGEETIDDALHIMRENKIKRLPVIDEKKNLVGIISMIDIANNYDKLDGEFFF